MAARGGRANQSRDPDVQLSKTLSYILRHGAKDMGLDVQEGGYIDVAELLQQPQLLAFSLEDVNRVVANNTKQRFHMEQDVQTAQFRIRANQGHTMQVDDLELTPITDATEVPQVIHGTNQRCWNSIRTQGLSRMKRNHIHFAPGEPGQDGVISGMRVTADVLVYINLEKALTDGLKFFRSANNVILCPGDEEGFLRPRYITQAVDRKTGTQLDVG